jgi:hypothetical protein
VFTITRNKLGLLSWAKRVSPDGIVLEWSPKEADACEVPPDVAGRVKGEYAGRPNAGTVTLTPVEGSHAPAVSADDVDALAESLRDAVAEIDRLRKLAGDKQAEIDLHAEEMTRLKQQSHAALKAAGEAHAAEVARLTAALDAATAPRPNQ